MKIVYVNRVFAAWGGLERVWTDKMNALSAISGHEVCLVTTDQGNHKVPYPLSGKVRHIDLGIRFVQQYRYKGLKRYWIYWQLQKLFQKRMKAFLETEKPDVLITNASEFADDIIKWKGKVPLVVESHGTFDRPFHMQEMTLLNRIKRFFHNKALAKADRIVALTRGDAEQWKQINPKVSVIPNIVTMNETDVYSDCKNKRVIFVGRLDTQKGFQYLNAIWEMIEERHPDWRLDIYGEGADLQENRSMMPQGKHVYPHAQTLDILDRYKESSILVLTSIYEPFGLVMPEAMSCGVPVVAFDCPYGPSEVITDGQDGFLVSCYDVKAFADKVSLLIEDESLRKKMGQNAVHSALRFRKDSIIPQWIDLFESLKD
jgi:glycosyltransferase involved in cell wall biosynthesis